MTSVMLPKTASLPAIRILDLPVNDVDMGGALDAIDGFVRERGAHHVITADSSMFVLAQSDEGLRNIIREAQLITPDSVGVLWAAKQYRTPLRERVSGVEIVERLCERSAQQGYGLYFLGAAPGIADLAAERMRGKYPGANIVGTQDGFFSPDQEPEIIAAIQACRPDILCVAMGIPKQEKWIASHRDGLDVSVYIGVGGTFDVLSGTTRRAPVMFQKLHLEWLWRVLSNPRKISKVLLLPHFVRLVRRAAR